MSSEKNKELKEMARKLITLWKRVPTRFGLGRYLNVHELGPDSPNFGIYYMSFYAAEKIITLLGPVLKKTALLKDDQVAILREAGGMAVGSKDISVHLPKDAGLAAEGGHIGTGWFVVGILPAAEPGQLLVQMACEYERIYINPEAESFHILDLLAAIPAGSSPKDSAAQEHLKSALELSKYRPNGLRLNRPEEMEAKIAQRNTWAILTFGKLWSARCSGCGAKGGASGKSMSYCTKCGGAHYCSKACQVGYVLLGLALVLEIYCVGGGPDS